jgi:hypothetical protein
MTPLLAALALAAAGPPNGFAPFIGGVERGDIELLAEYRPGIGDAIMSLRGTNLPGLGAAKGRKWRKLRVVLVGSRVSVWIDGEAVKRHAALGRLPRVGPVTLGRNAEWREVYVRAVPSDEANRILRLNGPEGYRSVFNGEDFTGWAGPLDQYEVKDGAIVCRPKKGGNIYTEAEYADFSVRLEYRLPPAGNNGLAIRYPGKGQPSQVAMCEVQILDDTAKAYARLDPRQYNGSAYGMIAARRGHLRPVGEWNFIEVTVRGHHIEVELNGTAITSGDLSKVKELMGGKGKNPGRRRLRGHFGFCGHNDPVAFRAIEVRELK